MYNYLWFFIIYAFLGWCCEVSFAVIKQGKFVNRGFCNGPVCPIYGFGVVIVVFCLKPIKENILILYIGSIILTSALEFLTGYLMEKCFKSRWWDYSDKKFNLKGYICLEFSMIWGIACVIVVDLIHPLFEKLVTKLPRAIGWPIVLTLVIGIAADAIYTIVCVGSLNKKLRQMDEFTKAMRKLSDAIGKSVANSTISVKESNEKLKVHGEKIISEIHIKNQERKKELQLKLEEIKKNKSILILKNKRVHLRLVKAFPKLEIKKHDEAFEELKQKLRSYKKRG